jgi:hypothetical protein
MWYPSPVGISDGPHPHKTMTDEIQHFIARWLRPEYQAPQATRTEATESTESSEGEGAEETPPAAGVPCSRTRREWPEGLAEQAAAVRAALAARGRPGTPEEIATMFAGAAFDAAPVARVGEWLAALGALGQARVGEDGRYATA